MNPETFFDNFGLLADTPNGVQKLRELILQLAVQGKLVRQDETDEPAAVVLEKIKAEKEKLIKERKVEGLKNLLSIKSEDTPHILPEGWAWTKLNQLGDLINGDRGKNYPSKQYYVNSGIPFINAGHLLNGKISLEKMNFITNDKYESLNNGKLLEGDIIYCLRGTLGKCAIFSGIKNGAIASSLVILRLNKKN